MDFEVIELIDDILSVIDIISNDCGDIRFLLIVGFANFETIEGEYKEFPPSCR